MAPAQLKYAEMARLSVLASLVNAVDSRNHAKCERVLGGVEQRHWNSHYFIISAFSPSRALPAARATSPPSHSVTVCTVLLRHVVGDGSEAHQFVGDGSEAHQFVGDDGHGVHRAVGNVAHGVHDLVVGIGMKVHTKNGNEIFERMSLG